ncbi:MAG: nucleotidyltransferase [Thermoprotei archaeon]|nr:MAG: nucleotidyltransferase [Thermoprotei archaeon]
MMVAILVGGFGKRLRPYTEETPKPLVSVAGKPILEWQITWLKKHGFNEIVLLVGYRKEKIIEHIGSGTKYGVKVTYVVEDEPLGTGGAIKNAEHILARENVFLVLNGDILTNLDPKPLIELALKQNYAAVIASIPLPSPYGILEISGEKVVGFKEKPQLYDYWINAGVYAMTPEVFDYLPEKGDIERTAFPKLAEEGKLGAIKYTGIFWKSIDTHKDLEEATKEIQRLGSL